MERPFDSNKFLKRLGLADKWTVSDVSTKGPLMIITVHHTGGYLYKLIILYNQKLDKVVNMAYSKEEN